MTETAAKGGFVVTLRSPAKNVLGSLTINDRTLENVIRALNIPPRPQNPDIQKAIHDVLSIYIYRDPD